MVSMEVPDLVRSGSDKPNSSQRIFGLETGRFFLLPALLLFQTEEMLIKNSFCVAFGSCPGTRCLYQLLRIHRLTRSTLHSLLGSGV